MKNKSAEIKKILRYLSTKINLIMLLILFLLIYLISTIDSGVVNTTIDLKDLKVYKIAVTEKNSSYETFYNIGIAVVTGFMVSYNYSRYNEFKEKKIVLLELEENLNNFMRFHLNILFSNKMLSQKLRNGSPNDMNLISNVIVYKDIESAYNVLKELAKGEYSKVLGGDNDEYPLRLKYMEYLYRLQKEYYLENYAKLLEKVNFLREKAYLFTSEENKALNKISTLIFQMGNIRKDIEEYEKHELIKGIIKNTYIGNLSERKPLTYSEFKSNGIITMNYFYELEEKIGYLEEPLKLCREYLGVNTYIYRYDYESILISKESFRESLDEYVLKPIIEKLEINLSSSDLEKALSSRVIDITKEKFRYTETQHWP